MEARSASRLRIKLELLRLLGCEKSKECTLFSYFRPSRHEKSVRVTSASVASFASNSCVSARKAFPSRCSFFRESFLFNCFPSATAPSSQTPQWLIRSSSGAVVRSAAASAHAPPFPINGLKLKSTVLSRAPGRAISAPASAVAPSVRMRLFGRYTRCRLSFRMIRSAKALAAVSPISQSPQSRTRKLAPSCADPAVKDGRLVRRRR